jgi:hypothetical protein
MRLIKESHTDILPPNIKRKVGKGDLKRRTRNRDYRKIIKSKQAENNKRTEFAQYLKFKHHERKQLRKVIYK